MRKNILWLYITVFINILGFGMVFPLLPLFAETLHATALDIGLLAGSFSIAQFLTSPILGRLSDRFGRKSILILSLVGSVVAFLIIAFAKNLEMIYLSRILNGISTAGVFPIAQAYIADITSKEERANYIGKISGIFALGFVFGPALGGAMGVLGFSQAFLLASVIAFLNLILVFFFLPESITQKAEKFVLREGLINIKAIISGLRGDFGVMFFLLFSWAFYISNYQVAIPLFTFHEFHMDTLQNGIFYAVTGIASTFSQWYVLPIMVKKFGDLSTILVGLILMIIGQFIAPMLSNLAIFYIFFTISVFGSGLNRPTINAFLSKKTLEGQGTTMGLAFSFESLGRVFGPIIAGFTMGKFGYAFPFYLTTVVLVIALLLFVKVEMQKSR